MEYENFQITWLGHACFKIKTNEKIIYIDPFQLDGGEKADLILITHDHFDHCSPEDVKKIQKEDTMIIYAGECGDKLTGNTVKVVPGDKKEFGGIEIKAVPAYNIDKFREENVPYHPKESNFVGFIIEADGKRIYHAGDTDLIPEMDVVTADVVLLPVGGTYTMDAREAAEAVKKINPSIAVPMHWGAIVGDENNAKDFSRLCDCEVRIMEKGE